RNGRRRSPAPPASGRSVGQGAGRGREGRGCLRWGAWPELEGILPGLEARRPGFQARGRRLETLAREGEGSQWLRAVSWLDCRTLQTGLLHGRKPMTDIPELTAEQFARALPARVRKRLMLGQFESGEDVAALRRFVGLSQVQFALAMGISVHTLRNW